MGDAQTNPLHEARQLLHNLRQQGNADLTAQLDQLDRLLSKAQQNGEGDDADTLRQKMDAVIQQNAQFISVMVHEIRVPMTSIRGYSDMLAKNVVGTLNEMQQQFVDTVRSNVIRMEHLVTDISDISKITAERIRLDSKMDMYKNIALEVEKNTKELATQHNHTLVFDTPSGLPLLNLDSARLGLALTKLVTNALQYTPDGGTITVKAEAVDGKLKVTVIDNGVGMTPEEQTHIGELFWRADNEHVRSFKGHGLGLPIAMGFIKLLGGEFFYESEAAKGSIFGFIVNGIS
ncbi:MAG TPA: HAMP domain-containing sensor histidine kinase [Aggregatilineaceae bacterium]|nr:HAMP domain-containing sensor histidine kinase [Aggregatilineaceae bacterium]